MSAWQISIGHADAADWITVGAYLVVAVLSARAARRGRLDRPPSESTFWRVTAVLLILFAINELLDLQTLLTSLARAHAKANGWYGEHRRVQYGFVVALALAAVFAGLVMLWLTRGMHAGVRLAVAGLGFIGLFVLLRAASFHHLDDLLGSGALVLEWGSIQELAGILIVAFAAVFYARQLGKSDGAHRVRHGTGTTK